MHTTKDPWFVLVYRSHRAWAWRYLVQVTNLATGEAYMTSSRTRRGGNRAARRIIVEVES